MIELLIIIICLYILYKFLGQYLLPRISERRLERYKKRFFEENPHIDSILYNKTKEEQEKRASILSKRMNYKH